MRTPFRLPTLLSASIFLVMAATQSVEVVLAGDADEFSAHNKPPARPLQYHRDGVVRLGDPTFEHQTQASTGQTTGNWLVWFYETGDATIIEGDVPDDDFKAEHNLVVAAVHAGLAKETVKRFQLTDFPCFLYFSRRKMYKYTGPLTWESISDFVRVLHEGSGGEGTSEALDVPPPRSEFVKMMEVLHAARVTHMLAVALTIVVGLFVVYARVVARSYERLHKEKDS